MEIPVLEPGSFRGIFRALKACGSGGVAEGKSSIGYGAVAFWLVVACLVAARVILFDPAKVYPSLAISASEAPTLAGQHYQ